MVCIAFNGLMMGCTKRYWKEIIMKIYSSFGTNSFSWSDVTRRYPEINKSNLSRLKCSEWIVKDKRNMGKPVRGAPKSVMWRLPPEAVALCNGGYASKPKAKKATDLKKVCKCQPIKK